MKSAISPTPPNTGLSGKPCPSCYFSASSVSLFSLVTFLYLTVPISEFIILKTEALVARKFEYHGIMNWFYYAVIKYSMTLFSFHVTK